VIPSGDAVIDEAAFAAKVAAGGVLEARGARIDAELIRSFCVRRAGEVDPRGIWLRGLSVTGTLDLTGVRVPFGLRFEECSFEAAPILHGAEVRALAFVDCPHLPGLLANGVEVRGDLELSGSRVTGRHPTSASNSREAAIWLCESAIGGRLRCLDTVIDAQGERAIQADRMRVGGTIRLLSGFHATGELRLVGIRVSGSLDMTGARVSSPGIAVDLADATIDGNMYIAAFETPEGARRPEIRGRLNLSSTRVDGTLVIKDATLVRPEHDEGRYHTTRLDNKALVGLRLFVGAELTIEGETTISGGVDLSLAELGGLTLGEGCAIDAPGRTALNLINAEVRSDVTTLGVGVRVKGTILLIGSRIRGRLDLNDAVLSDPRGLSLLKSDGATIDGDVEIKRVQATGGQLKFWRTSIGGGFDAHAAVVENPTGGTVRLHSCQVGGSIRLVADFRSTGCVVLSRTEVGGSLDLGGGRFDCPSPGRYNVEGAAIRAVSATFKGGMDLGWADITPTINLTDTTTSVLQDDPSRWPERIYIAGFRYERFAALRSDPARRRIWDWNQRLLWLRRQPEYDAGPYEQAARVFRQHGYVQAAEHLLIAQRADARRAERRGRRLSWARTALDWTYDWTVGYGYRPGRVLWLLVALLALVSVTLAVPTAQETMRASDEGVVFTTHGPVNPGEASTVDPCGGGRVRCFNPLLYAVDTVVPLVALDQRSTWYPDRFVPGGWAVEWLLNLATVAGWLLSSIFLLSFARLARNT